MAEEAFDLEYLCVASGIKLTEEIQQYYAERMRTFPIGSVEPTFEILFSLFGDYSDPLEYILNPHYFRVVNEAVVHRRFIIPGQKPNAAILKVLEIGNALVFRVDAALRLAGQQIAKDGEESTPA